MQPELCVYYYREQKMAGFYFNKEAVFFFVAIEAVRALVSRLIMSTLL